MGNELGNLGFEQFLRSNDLSKNLYGSDMFNNEERAGMLTSYENLKDTNQLGLTIGAGNEFLRSKNILGDNSFSNFLGSKGFENGLGVANLGVGILGYLDDKKTAKAQRNLMGQQARANDWAYNKQVANSAALGKAFGTA